MKQSQSYEELFNATRFCLEALRGLATFDGTACLYDGYPIFRTSLGLAKSITSAGCSWKSATSIRALWGGAGDICTDYIFLQIAKKTAFRSAEDLAGLSRDTIKAVPHSTCDSEQKRATDAFSVCFASLRSAIK